MGYTSLMNDLSNTELVTVFLAGAASGIWVVFKVLRYVRRIRDGKDSWPPWSNR